MGHEDRQTPRSAARRGTARPSPTRASRAIDPRADVGDGAHDEVGGRERRRDHEPVTHVRRRHLRSTRTRPARATRAAPTIVRSGGSPDADDQQDGGPRERAGERQRDRDRRGGRSSSRATRPPTVAAMRPSDSIRRNAYSPRPARIGLRTMNDRRASPADSVENSAIGGAYNQPLCGSAAKRYPAISNGFHSGICPAPIESPRKDQRGSQNVRRSGCWFVRAPPTTKPRSANRTQTTIRAGPSRRRGAPRRERARIRGVHASQPTAPSPLSRKTSGRVGRPQHPVAFNTS